MKIQEVLTLKRRFEWILYIQLCVCVYKFQPVPSTVSSSAAGELRLSYIR